jgi:ATP-dependent RNA helicase DDX54/DBP10
MNKKNTANNNADLLSESDPEDRDEDAFNEKGLGDEEERMDRDAMFGRKNKNVRAGSFESFNLSQEIFRAVKKKGYNMPTPIQRKAIPVIMEGFNIIAMARTGSGKTGAFVIPVVERLKAHSKIVGARCIILSPTREIAMQSANYLKQIAANTDLTYVLIVGGNDMENQFERLVLNPDIIIATPGRLMHCI